MPEIHLCEDINKLHVDSGSDLFEERFWWTNNPLFQIEMWNISDTMGGELMLKQDRWLWAVCTVLQ